MPRFKLGQVLITPGAEQAIRNSGEDSATFIARHHREDWGDLDPEDAAQNHEGLISGEGRLMSAYTLKDGEKIWIITEWDRSATTILLPSEY